MVFQAMRNRMKGIIIVVAVAFALSLLYVGGASLWGWRSQSTVAEAVASVNGTEIGYPAWQRAYIQLVQNQEAAGQRITGQQVETAQYYALQQLINRELLLQEAENRKINPSRAEVNAQLKSIKEQFDSEADFSRQLAASNMTERDLKELIRENLKIEELRNQVVADVTVTLDEVKREYEEVKARHILIRPDGDDEAAWDAAKVRAQAVLDRLTKGEDFAEVAKEVSQDPGTADKGGDLGFFGRGKMVPEFEEAAFALDVGQISGLVKTKYGYHIIKVEDKKLPEGEEFKKAEAEIRERLKSAKEDEAFQKWFEAVREKADIQLTNARMKAFEAASEGKWEEAAAAYEQAIADQPEDPYLYASLAEVYEELDRSEDALRHLEIAASKAEFDPQLQMRLGDKYREAKQEDKALEAYAKASDADPMNFLLHLQLLNVYQQMGKDDLVAAEEEKLENIQKIYAEMRKAQEEQQQAEGDGAQSGEKSKAGGDSTAGETDSDGSANEAASEAEK